MKQLAGMAGGVEDQELQVSPSFLKQTRQEVRNAQFPKGM